MKFNFFFSHAMLISSICSFLPLAALESDSSLINKWTNISSLESMYAEEDLSECPLFVGGFINFGFWKEILDPHLDQKNFVLSYEERLLSEKNLYRKLMQESQVSTTDFVIEIGCGLGLGSSLIADEFHPKHIVGIDISLAQVERAKALNKKNIDNGLVSFCLGSAEKIPFESAVADIVYSVEAPQHFSSFSEFTREAHRVLKDKGCLALTTFFGVTSDSENQAKPLIQTVEDGIDHIIPISEVEKILRDAGFSKIEIKSIGNHVWKGFDKWISQTELRDTWDKNWYDCYQSNIIDYYVVIARK